MKDFLIRKDIQLSPKRYFVDAMGAMAYALFATLLVGTILKTIGQSFDISFLSETVWPIANQATGPAIAMAIAYSLRAPQLVMFSSCLVGIASYNLGGPLGVFIASIVAVECGKTVSGETKLDILLTPVITVLVGIGIAYLIGPAIAQLMKSLGQIIVLATETNPIAMGAIIATVVGLVLTLPISSAALCLMLELEGTAAGAATIGCCAQMIGFAVISFKDNGWKGVLPQGIGTSMLQMPNIYKNWRIWIPPTLAATIIGPIATRYFEMKNTALEAGMGTCGLVGQIGTFNAMQEHSSNTTILINIVILHFLAPGIIAYLIYRIMRNKQWIKDGDMTLQITQKK